MVAAELLTLVPDWEDEGFGAVIVGCFSDPGLVVLW
jgi:Asp/Glu/hydantoin racemase